MTDQPEPPAPQAPATASPAFPSFASTTRQDQERQRLRERKWGRVVLTLSLAVGLTALGVWMSRPAQPDIRNLPRVTLEVHGMS